MASWLVHSSLGQVVRVGALEGTLCCVLEQDTTLAVPLSAQVYKWLPANVMLGETL